VNGHPFSNRTKYYYTVDLYSADFITGDTQLRGIKMNNAIFDHLLPKMVRAGINIKHPGNQLLLLMFMKSIKKAKEMLLNLPMVR
jgi:hypothetical protein